MSLYTVIRPIILQITDLNEENSTIMHKMSYK